MSIFSNDFGTSRLSTIRKPLQIVYFGPVDNWKTTKCEAAGNTRIEFEYIRLEGVSVSFEQSVNFDDKVASFCANDIIENTVDDSSEEDAGVHVVPSKEAKSFMIGSRAFVEANRKWTKNKL